MPSRAALMAQSAGYRSLGDTPTVWAQVTRASHPLLHGALSAITHDGGGGADHDHYNIPPGWVGHLSAMEAALSTLTSDQRETLAIGEQTECVALVAATPGLTFVHSFLDAFFDDFTDCEGPNLFSPEQPPEPEVITPLELRYVQRGTRRDLEFRLLEPPGIWGPWRVTPVISEEDAQ
jgi:hypothetical protein